MRRLITALSVALLLAGGPVTLANPAFATVSGVCGSDSKLAAGAPYAEDSILVHLVSSRGSLKCGPYSASRQWKVKIVLQEYFSGSWHVVGSATSGWRTAKSGTVSTSPASVNCLVALIPHKFRGQATGYVRSSSRGATTTLGPTLSDTTTRYC